MTFSLTSLQCDRRLEKGARLTRMRDREVGGAAYLVGSCWRRGCHWQPRRAWSLLSVMLGTLSEEARAWQASAAGEGGLLPTVKVMVMSRGH